MSFSIILLIKVAQTGKTYTLTSINAYIGGLLGVY
jgi:hypothetical protein